MNKDPNEVIDNLGGTSVVAKMCDITTGAVSQWRTNGIPKPWMKYLATVRKPKKKSKNEKA